MNNPQSSAQLLTIREASNFLNLKVSRIRYEVFHRKIPHIRIGRSIMFSEKDLINWIACKKQEVVNDK